jgi:hypothetical protein
MVAASSNDSTLRLMYVMLHEEPSQYEEIYRHLYIVEGGMDRIVLIRHNNRLQNTGCGSFVI